MMLDVENFRYHSLEVKRYQEGLMINRVVNFIFIDFLALAINATLGTVLRTKICNYSWEGEHQTSKANSNSNKSISTELEQEED